MGAERQGAGQGCALCGCLDLVHSLNLRTCEDMCEDFGCFLEFPTPSHVRSVASRVAAEDGFHDRRHRQKLGVRAEGSEQVLGRFFSKRGLHAWEQVEKASFAI